jgi:hypothetical protein
MSTQHRRNCADSERQKSSVVNLFQCHFVQQKSHTKCPGIEFVPCSETPKVNHVSNGNASVNLLELELVLIAMSTLPLTRSRSHTARVKCVIFGACHERMPQTVLTCASIVVQHVVSVGLNHVRYCMHYSFRHRSAYLGHAL